jgi:hypothetical protein
MHGASLHLQNLNRKLLAIAFLLAFAAHFLASEGGMFRIEASVSPHY